MIRHASTKVAGRPAAPAVQVANRVKWLDFFIMAPAKVLRSVHGHRMAARNGCQDSETAPLAIAPQGPRRRPLVVASLRPIHDVQHQAASTTERDASSMAHNRKKVKMMQNQATATAGLPRAGDSMFCRRHRNALRVILIRIKYANAAICERYFARIFAGKCD